MAENLTYSWIAQTRNLSRLCSDFCGTQKCKWELISIHSTQALARLHSFISDMLAGTVLEKLKQIFLQRTTAIYQEHEN